MSKKGTYREINLEKPLAGLFLFNTVLALVSFIAGWHITVTPLELNPNKVVFSFEDIFLNNFLIQMEALISGFCTFGIAGLYYECSNFFLLGNVFREMYMNFDLKTAIIHIFPHGLVEIPSMILTATLSQCFLYVLYESVKLRDKKLLEVPFVLLIINIFLILLAALSECYITKSLIEIAD
ncbi:MAG: stage II sporulation protein M [Micrococcaceae bacterium]